MERWEQGNRSCEWFNTRYLADDIFKCILLNENVLILIKISLEFIPKGPINNIEHWFR